MALLSVEDALARLIGGAARISRTETVDLFDADGRVLAEPVSASLTQPPFDNSAMDGYALRAEDVASLGTRLDVIGESAAGRRFAGTVGKGQAVRIFTGAPMPEGADAVLLQEDAIRLDGNIIETNFVVTEGRHVRPRGQDFLEGEVVLNAGEIMDAGRVTVAAAMNRSQVTVYRKPLIAVIATGDELVSAGTAPGPDQIVASSIYGVSALAKAAGADVLYLGIVSDDRSQIEGAVAKAQEARADIIVTLGGASVGDHDLVQPVLKSIGMELDFWKIAMRPGKPLMVGSLGDARVLGLPGNPVSSMVCSLLFLEPLVAHMAHLPPPERRARAVAAMALAENDHRQDYLRARLVRRPDGMLEAHSFGKQDSSQMKIFAGADCLIVRAPNAEALPAGAECDILTLRHPA
ncbi:molybdopterin molybdotransferase MoeA [Rhizobium sp. LjRoot254]|uniref:molybdopterin molybdotransferase MoeA n=1 Tax=Rhizobium sp. LjRoot254 TaxID=3342297 RepID=UPI003ECD894B